MFTFIRKIREKIAQHFEDRAQSARNALQAEKEAYIIEKQNLIDAEVVKKAKEFEFNRQFYIDLVNESSAFTYVMFDGTKFSINSIDSIPAANIALKELRIFKRVAMLKKKEITNQYKEIRDDYNQQIGSQIPLTAISGIGGLIGLGEVDTILRAGIRTKRAAERSKMADIKHKKESMIEPWDQIVDYVNRGILAVESEKIKIQSQEK